MELENWKDVVYSVQCETCGLCYIGETGQHFCDRRDQHKRDINQKKTSNALYDHVTKNEGHKINWENICFLDKEKNWKGRKIKEAIYINAIVPTSMMDKEKLMNLEKGFELDPIWKELNPPIRDQIKHMINQPSVLR